MSRVKVAAKWLAGDDRIAHCTVAGQLRTLCQQPPVPERWAWPAASRCERCRVALDAVERGVPISPR